jgi:NADH-quinone oxidoreductase subunit D
MMQINDDTYLLNFGPHHPSTHGVLRLQLKMHGEEVVACEPEIGYLHRGVENLVESKKFMSIIPYIDRLDYLSPVIQEHAYVLAIEKLLKIKPPERAVFIRTIFDELTRISSHIMGIGSMTFDLGCLSLFLYGFEEREKIMDIFKKVTGTRMHLAYYVPSGVRTDITDDVIKEITAFLDGFNFYLDAVNKLALSNRIFIKRTKDIGKISSVQAVKNGLSGVNLRASGVAYDIRQSLPYGVYELLKFTPIILTGGDCYDRTKLRVLEIKQSCNLIKQCLKLLPVGDGTLNNTALWHKEAKLPQNTIIYSATETPRGEFGIHMVIEYDQTKPYRVHFKSPSFAHIQFLKELLIGVKIPDITAILGSLDFIMGCCDR